MKTKAFFITTMMFVFLLIYLTGIHAQTAKSNIDQVKLMSQALGTWEATVDKDTVIVRDYQEYGKAYTVNVYYIVKGKKTPYYISNYCIDSKEGKFKGFILYADGRYGTWIGLWTSDKKISIDAVQNFNPEIVAFKVEYVYDTPKSVIETRFSATGVKILERKFKKVK